MKQLFCILFFGILLFSCSNGTAKWGKTLEADYIEADTLCSTPQCVIILQPYEDFSRKEVEKLLPKLQKAFGEWLYGYWEFKIANPISLPKNSYVKERNRYRVTPILNYESKQLTGYEVIIGLTHKDICTDIHGQKDYGIVGISRPLKQVSLVSDKRLKEKSLINHYIGSLYFMSSSTPSMGQSIVPMTTQHVL